MHYEVDLKRNGRAPYIVSVYYTSGCRTGLIQAIGSGYGIEDLPSGRPGPQGPRRSLMVPEV